MRLGDDVRQVIADALLHSESTTADMALVDRKTFALTRKICTLLPALCAAQQISSGKASLATDAALGATFDRVEQDTAHRGHMNRLHEMARLASNSRVEGSLWADPSLSEVAAQRKRECNVFAAGMVWPPPRTLLEVGFNTGTSLSMFLMLVPSIVRVHEFDMCEHPYVKPNFADLRNSFPAVEMALYCGDSKVTLGSHGGGGGGGGGGDGGGGVVDVVEKGIEAEVDVLPLVLRKQEGALTEEDGGLVDNERGLLDTFTADVIHIDGGHDFDTAWLDIVNAGKFARGARHARGEETGAGGSRTLLIIDNVDGADSLEGAVAAAVDADIITLVGGASGACRYGSVFAWYT